MITTYRQRLEAGLAVQSQGKANAVVCIVENLLGRARPKG